ncbi:MAG: 6-carboxytetrahydropterin synthase QueD [Gemmatimonadetes bacterium]|nr:6-carboxytetrahydropterin synthase QueD [Gemmatimonadota bacterium]
MYIVSVQAHYDAAHFLRNYRGKCERLHGHRYVVEVALQAEELNEAGIAYDFVDVKRYLNELADAFDHRNLNDLPPFTEMEPSAENQARYFYEELKKGLPPRMAAALLYARVWETPTQWAQFGAAPFLPPGGAGPAGAE